MGTCIARSTWSARRHPHRLQSGATGFANPAFRDDCVVEV
jgi:hypothetical protein